MENKVTSMYPLMELPWMAFSLAIAAGSMNGYTYFIGKSFSTVQSGNIILLGQSLAVGDWSHFKVVLLTVFSFGLGSVLTAILLAIADKKKKIWSFEILLIEAGILLCLGFSPINNYFSVLHLCMLISFIAGMQGNAFHKINGMLYGNVAVTLNVQLAFNYLIQGIMGVKNGWKNCWIFTSVLLGFAGGGLIGTLLTVNYGEKALWFTAMFLFILVIYSKIMKVKTRVIDVDPT